MSPQHSTKRRILVIDDSDAIHKDFQRILGSTQKTGSTELDALEDALFGTAPRGPSTEVLFEVDSAFQGQEGLSMVKAALAAGHPYALAFLDYRMPPGWNGVETLRQLRQVTPTLPVVLCSAYSDSSWEQSIQELGQSKLLVELRKPFNRQQLRQIALDLSEPRPAP